jgi:hypothetical protein
MQKDFGSNQKKIGFSAGTTKKSSELDGFSAARGSRGPTKWISQALYPDTKNAKNDSACISSALTQEAEKLWARRAVSFFRRHAAAFYEKSRPAEQKNYVHVANTSQLQKANQRVNRVAAAAQQRSCAVLRLPIDGWQAHAFEQLIGFGEVLTTEEAFVCAQACRTHTHTIPDAYTSAPTIRGGGGRANQTDVRP